MSDLQRKLKEKDLKIKKLEAALDAAGIKNGEATTSSTVPNLSNLQQKLAELEARNERLQVELEEEKKRSASQSISDLARDLQTKLRKRDENITNLNVEIKKRDDFIAKLENEINEMGKSKPPTQGRW